MLCYTFQVMWLEGKANTVADALSRNPVDPEEPFPLRSYIVAPSQIAEEINDAARNCPDYVSVVEAWKNGTHAKDLPPQHPGRCLQDVWDSILAYRRQPYHNR